MRISTRNRAFRKARGGRLSGAGWSSSDFYAEEASGVGWVEVVGRSGTGNVGERAADRWRGLKRAGRPEQGVVGPESLDIQRNHGVCSGHVVIEDLGRTQRVIVDGDLIDAADEIQRISAPKSCLTRADADWRSAHLNAG